MYLPRFIYWNLFNPKVPRYKVQGSYFHKEVEIYRLPQGTYMKWLQVWELYYLQWVLYPTI